MYANPFIYKRPLYPGTDDLIIIKRNALLAKAISGLEFGHWYTVCGGKKIGKTTFLLSLMDECNKKNLSYHFILVKPEELLHFDQTALYRVLCQRMKELIPNSDEALSTNLLTSPGLENLKDFMAAVSTRLDPKSRVIIILDSCETPPKIFAQETFRALINLHQSQAVSRSLAKFQFIISGTLNTIDLQIEHGHSLSEYTMRVLLEDFRGEAVEDMLSRVSAHLNISCQPGLGRLVYETTNGTGYLVQKICYRILEKAYLRKEQPEFTIKNAEIAIDSIIKEGETNVEMVITQIEKDGQLVESLVRTLRAGAISSNKFDPHLKALVALGAISEYNGVYRVRNRIYETAFQDYFTSERLADRYFAQQEYQRVRKLISEAVTQKANANNALNALLGNINFIGDEIGQGDIVTRILEAFMNVVDSAKCCSLMLLDKDSGTLRIFDAIGLDHEIIQSFTLQLGHGIAGWVAQVGRSRIIRDVTDEIECPDFADRDMAVKLNLGAMVSLPLKVSGNVLGVINLCLGRPREFSDSEVKVLETMAAYASLILQNAQFHLDLERYSLHLSQVRAVVREAGQHTELEPIFQKILKAAGNICGTDKSYLVYREPVSRNWMFSFSENHQSIELKLPQVDKGEGIVGYVLKTGRPYAIKDTEQDNHYFAIWKGMRWELAVPCLGEGESQGCLVATSDQALAFSQAQVQLLTVLADAVALALKNKRLYGIAEKKTQQVITAHGISEALSHENSLQEILNLIAHECLNVVGREDKISFVWIKDNDRDKLILKAAAGEAFGRKHVGRALSLNQRSIVVWVTKNGLPRLAKDVTQDSEYRQTHPTIKSEIAVPLIFRDETIGVIDLQSTRRNDFDEQDLENLTAVAHNAAVATKIGELYDLRIKNEIGLSRALEAAAIEESVASVTHDIKNISSLISGETQWLQKLGGKNQLNMSEVETAITNINSYVTRIEDYAKYLNSRASKLPPELRWCNLRNVIGEAVQVISAKALRYGVEIKMDESALEVQMYVDPGRLMRAFFNIMANAVDAMPTGGTLQISARHDSEHIRIDCSDTGAGIPEENLHKVLQPFFTTKKQGYGLGLAITKRIIETDHQGKLSLHSKPGQGTTVEVWLPHNLYVRAENNNGAHDNSSNSKFHHREKGNILVVNDDTTMLNNITRLLGSEGHNVTGAESGKAAVEICRTQKFDAIVLDYHLKKDHSATQTAIDFVPALKKNAPTTPIILTSASLDCPGFPDMDGDFFLEINQAFWRKILDLIDNCLLGKPQLSIELLA